MATDMDELNVASGFALTGDQRRSSVEIDYEYYEKYLEDSDLTVEQKRQFIEALWQIIVGFVDLGFGVHPVQQAQNACGKLGEDVSKPTPTAGKEVELGNRFLSENFDDAADLVTDAEAGGFNK